MSTGVTSGLSGIAILLAAAIGLVSPAPAQWIQSGSSIGNHVSALAMSGPNLVAGSFLGGGVYCSSDKGMTWNGPAFAGLAVNELIAQVPYVFMATSQGIYVSDNDGTSWRADKIQLTDRYVFRIAPVGPMVLAWTDGGKFVSADSGSSWTPYSMDLDSVSGYSNLNAVAPFGPDLFAATDNGIFRSNDAGANWHESDSGLTSLTARALAVLDTELFATTYGGGVFCSTDGGHHWNARNAGFDNLDLILLGSDGVNLFAEQFPNAIYVSTDRGMTWNKVWFRTSVLAYSMIVTSADVLLGANGGYVWHRPKPEMLTWSISPIKYPQGWKMISLPLKPLVDTYWKLVLAPCDLWSLFDYTGNAYIAEDSLFRRRGYWLRSSVACTYDLKGTAVLTDSFPLEEGWNLIGSLSSPVPVASITSDPPGMVTSRFFGYNGSYVAANVLEPGEAYWVKVSQPGLLRLSTFSKTQSPARIRIVATDELPPPSPWGEIQPRGPDIPREYALNQNYPNPFNPSTSIGYQVPEESRVSMVIYDALGQEVRRLVDGVRGPGYYSVDWNASGAPTGAYFCRLSAASLTNPLRLYTSVRKLEVVR